MAANVVEGMALKQGMGECKAALNALSLDIKMDSFHSVQEIHPEDGSEGCHEVSLGWYGQRILQLRMLYELSMAIFLQLNVRVHLKNCMKEINSLPLSGYDR